jgi:hypothetical protein
VMLRHPYEHAVNRVDIGSGVAILST